MLRVSVVGSSCSGKTTIARRIAAHHQIPHFELDAIFWQPNWTPLPLDQYRSKVEAIAAEDQWVIDGNYSRVRDIVWARATDVVWMNLPLRVLLWRVVKRTVQRIRRQEVLFAGNRETFRNTVLSRDSLIWWVVRTHRGRNKALREALKSERYSHLKLHELTKPTDGVLPLGSELSAG